MIGEIRDTAPERIAQYAEYDRLVRARLQVRTAATYELFKIIRDAGVPTRRFFGWLRQHQTIADRAGKTIGPTGHENIIWKLKS